MASSKICLSCWPWLGFLSGSSSVCPSSVLNLSLDCNPWKNRSMIHTHLCRHCCGCQSGRPWSLSKLKCTTNVSKQPWEFEALTFLILRLCFLTPTSSFAMLAHAPASPPFSSLLWGCLSVQWHLWWAQQPCYQKLWHTFIRPGALGLTFIVIIQAGWARSLSSFHAKTSCQNFTDFLNEETHWCSLRLSSLPSLVLQVRGG